jgi:hypothetical protein
MFADGENEPLLGAGNPDKVCGAFLLDLSPERLLLDSASQPTEPVRQG